MPYLICERCKGYYKLHNGESNQDFLRCSCGGNLVYSEELELEKSEEPHYIQDMENYYGNNQNSGDPSDIPHSRRVGYWFYLVVVMMVFISIAAAASYPKIFTQSNNTTKANSNQIGINSFGYVDKYVYNGQKTINSSGKKVAIVTGIHPREKLSKAVWTDLLKNYHAPEGVQIVQYDINVVDDPDDFSLGRSHGESLAATYILEDISKSQYDLIIVCHDHEPGYGEGFFIATPRMDDKSVNFAESLTQRLSTFNYYKNYGNTNEGTSNIHFTDYLVSSGHRTLVYEMPGLSSYGDAYRMTKLLLDDSCQTLDGI